MEIDAVIESVHQQYPNLRVALRWNHAYPGDAYVPVCVGHYLPRSYEWDDGEPTDEELIGTCALCIPRFCTCGYRHSAAQQEWSAYADGPGQLVVIVGWDSRVGTDIGELIIRDAMVAAVLGDIAA